MTTEKPVNYTPEMVAELVAAAPLNLDSAKAFAEKFGKNYRSIIAKCKRENIEYVNVVPETKKPKGITKMELVNAIQEKMNLELMGLEKAPLATLQKLLASC